MTWLEDLKRLMKAATPGPWKAWADEGDHYSICRDDNKGNHWCIASIPYKRNRRWWSNCKVIVAAINALPRLIAIAEAAEKLLAADELAGVPGYLGDNSGWECAECAPMDGSGKRANAADVEHEADCYMKAIEAMRAALNASDESGVRDGK